MKEVVDFEADGEDEFDPSAAEPQAKKQKTSELASKKPASQQEDLDDADEVRCLPV